MVPQIAAYVLDSRSGVGAIVAVAIGVGAELVVGAAVTGGADEPEVGVSATGAEQDTSSTAANASIRRTRDL